MCVESWLYIYYYYMFMVDELKELWEIGVQTWDAFGEENFTLHASVLWTINDFPAYGSLSGWSTKGYKACPISDPVEEEVEAVMGEQEVLPMHGQISNQHLMHLILMVCFFSTKHD